MATPPEANYIPAPEASLTASFRLSPNWSLFIEPQVQVFSGKFSTDMGYGSRQAIGSLTAGVHYTFGNFYHDYPKALEEFLKDRNWFLTLGFSPVKRFRGDYGNGMAGSVGFGRRFTPLSSWRITAEGEIFRRQPIYVSATVAADYLFSISTAMAGYDSERLFDLSGVMGVFGGVVDYVDPAKAVYGGKIGLNGSFRLNDALSLFVEPQLLGVCPRGLGNPGWTPELRVMLGLNYRLGTFKGPRGSIADAVFGGDDRNFVSLAGGPTVNSSDNDRASGALQASVGRWFSLVSGLRFNLGYDFLMSPHRDNVNLTTANIDYLLNVTSLIDRNPKRRFHIISAIRRRPRVQQRTRRVNRRDGQRGTAIPLQPSVRHRLAYRTLHIGLHEPGHPRLRHVEQIHHRRPHFCRRVLPLLTSASGQTKFFNIL